MVKERVIDRSSVVTELKDWLRGVGKNGAM